MSKDYAEILREIEADVEKYSPYPDKVKIVAVSKYVEPEVALEAYKQGIKCFGENRAQLLLPKKDYFEKNVITDVEWHFIGNLQTNKVRQIAPFVTMIHSVNRLSLAREIDVQAKKYRRVIPVLLEINIYGEESKEGYEIDTLIGDIPALTNLENLNIIGLMTMAPITEKQDILDKVFGGLRSLQDRLNAEYFGGRLTELSMGMTNDYKVALTHGATIVRIGSKIFK